MWKTRRQIRTAPPPQRLPLGPCRESSSLIFSARGKATELRSDLQWQTRRDQALLSARDGSPASTRCSVHMPSAAFAPGPGVRTAPLRRGERRERHVLGRAPRLETSGVRLCARRAAAGGRGQRERREATRRRAGWPPRGKDAVPARPPARTTPGPRAGTHAEGMGRAAGERRRGVRPPRSPRSLAPQPLPPSLSFSPKAGQLRGRARIRARRAAPLDYVRTLGPAPAGFKLGAWEIPRS